MHAYIYIYIYIHTHTYHIYSVLHVSLLILLKSMIYWGPHVYELCNHMSRAVVPTTQLCDAVCKCSLELWECDHSWLSMLLGNALEEYIGQNSLCLQTLNEWFTQKWTFCHYLHILMSLFFLQKTNVSTKKVNRVQNNTEPNDFHCMDKKKFVRKEFLTVLEWCGCE